MQTFRVAVYGATGHTARMVGSDLERRGVSVLRIARRIAHDSSQAGDSSDWIGASCEDPDALDRALKNVQAVINCAGPFMDTAPALIEAALLSGIHYFDITAEQRSVRQSLATYHQEAQQRGVVILPAMAFYGGLADLLVGKLCKGLDVVEAVQIAVALNHWHPTAGTRHTGERNSARRLVVRAGRFAPLVANQPDKTWQFPAPFGKQQVVPVPLSEIVTIARHVRAERIESFMNRAPLDDLNRATTPPPVAADASGKSSQEFVMEAIVTAAGASRRMAAFGRDIYASSAPMVVEACVRVLSDPATTGGTFAPAELFDADDFLAALAPDLQVA